jgi:hypothetical protein
MKELSDEYDPVKWGVIAKIMEIEQDECISHAKELQLI